MAKKSWSRPRSSFFGHTRCGREWVHGVWLAGTYHQLRFNGFSFRSPRCGKGEVLARDRQQLAVFRSFRLGLYARTRSQAVDRSRYPVWISGCAVHTHSGSIERLCCLRFAPLACGELGRGRCHNTRQHGIRNSRDLQNSSLTSGL